MAGLAGLAIGSGKNPESISWFALDEGPAMPGFMGVDDEQHNSDQNIVEEKISIRMKGTQAEMEALLRQVAFALRGARDPNSPERAYLRLWSAGLQAEVYARIIQARFEVLPDHLQARTLGSFMLRICLVRERLFVGNERRLEIFNSSGMGDALGLRIYNHDDAQSGHDNWFGFQNEALNLDLPCPLRLEFLVPSGGASVGDLYVGSLLLHEAGSFPAMSLEAENGSGGVTVSDPSASNGNFQRYSWTGSGWATLGTWNLDTMMVSKLNGHSLLPILRLHHPISQGGVRLRLVLRQQAEVIYQGPACYVRANQSAQRFAPMALNAPGLPALTYAEGMTLSLEGSQNELGMTLDVDDILLMPQKTFRFHQSLSGLHAGSTLIDDTWRELSWTLREQLELKSHLSSGVWHCLLPGMAQRFYVFMADPTCHNPIDLSLKVRAWVRPVVEVP